MRASLVTYPIPIVALGLGWAVLGEQMSATTAGGAVLIISGVAGVLYAPSITAPTLEATKVERAVAESVPLTAARS